jgi:hypothetical protein
MIEWSDDDAQASLDATLGLTVDELKRVAEQTHVLTHRRLRVTIATGDITSEPTVQHGATYDCLAWKATSELGSLAMSSLARKVLLACSIG